MSESTVVGGERVLVDPELLRILSDADLVFVAVRSKTSLGNIWEGGVEKLRSVDQVDSGVDRAISAGVMGIIIIDVVDDGLIVTS